MKMFIILIVGILFGYLLTQFVLIPQTNIKSITAKLLAPGYGTCYRCDMPWKFVNPHSTYYVENRGCFPLCEDCWQTLTIEQRLPYYKTLWAEWQKNGPDSIKKWELIEKAVLEGK